MAKTLKVPGLNPTRAYLQPCQLLATEFSIFEKFESGGSHLPGPVIIDLHSSRTMQLFFLVRPVGPIHKMSAKVVSFREIVQLPANRPTFVLLMRSTLAMIIVPLSVYFLCFHLFFGKAGPLCLWDLSEDLNSRVNFSGFAAIASVQVRSSLT